VKEAITQIGPNVKQIRVNPTLFRKLQNLPVHEVSYGHSLYGVPIVMDLEVDTFEVDWEGRDKD
jgi:hypothetical protein